MGRRIPWGGARACAPAGEWTEDFLRASWPSRGLSRSPNRVVADKRRLAFPGTIITALLHCRICSGTGSGGLPRPPPQHPTSVPFIRKQPGFQPSPQTLTRHTRSLPLSSLLTPQIICDALVAKASCLWNVEICSPSKPLCRVSPKFQGRRSATESSLLCRSLLHCYLYGIAVSS